MVIRLLAALAAFLTGAAAMAWYLTRWHDDREPTYLAPGHRRLLDDDGGLA